MPHEEVKIGCRCIEFFVQHRPPLPTDDSTPHVGSACAVKSFLRKKHFVRKKNLRKDFFT
jgi:hypothetical protein